MSDHSLPPEGTVCSIYSESADSPVGRRGVVRKLQYEVRDGREADEVIVFGLAFIAKRNSSFILLDVGEEE